MRADHTGLEARARRALDEVVDPELDEPITDLGFVRSVTVTDTPSGTALEVHLRLPTSFCSPNFAWLMAGDAREALAALDGIDRVVVALDDHHDSDLINRGLASGADYLQTFGHEAEQGLDELRATFRRKAHTAAMERALTALLRTRPDLDGEPLASVRLADLPDDELRTALVRRRRALGLATDPGAPVLVDDAGVPVPATAAAAQLRRARSVRISVDGNAHFCRGLLTTRYPDAAGDQRPRLDAPDHPQRLLPLLAPQKLEMTPS